MLLGFETVHVHGQLGGRDDVGQKNKFPTRQLGAVTKVQIFGQRIVLPAPRFIDAGTSPEASGSLKIEKASAAAAGGLLKEEMAVEEHRLDASEERVTAVKMTPAGLDHADLRIGKEMDRPFEQVGLRHEIGVENANEVALRRSQAGLKRAGFETGAVCSMNQLHIEPTALQFRHRGCRELPCIIRRIVEDLNLETVLWIIDLAHRAEEALHHIYFVEDRQLHRHHGQLLELTRWHSRTLPVFQKQINDDVTMNAICGEADEHAHVAHCPDDRGESSLHSGLEKPPRCILRSRAT